MGTTPSLKNIPELDGIRGIAVLLVLGLHVFYGSMYDIFSRQPLKPWPFAGVVLARATEFGWAGVDLFFVLSGFLVTLILLLGKRPSSNGRDCADARQSLRLYESLRSVGRSNFVRNFYIRRALRLFPAYYALLLILFWIGYDRHSLLLDALFLGNVTQLFHVPWGYFILWSVSVEVHFYLVWPWLILWLDRRRLTYVAFGIVALEPCLRALGALGHENIYAYSWFRFDEFAAGALVALLFSSASFSRKQLAWLSAACLTVAACLIALDRFLYPLSTPNPMELNLQITMMELFAVALLSLALFSSGKPWGSLFRSRLLTTCGKWSYALYLVQSLILYEGWRYLNSEFPLMLGSTLGDLGTVCLRALFTCVFSLFIAFLSYQYLEMPANRLRLERFH